MTTCEYDVPHRLITALDSNFVTFKIPLTSTTTSESMSLNEQ